MATIGTCPGCGARNRLRPSPSGTPRCARCKTRLPWLVDADEGSFAEETRASVPVVVDLWAPWCAPCRAVTPVLERFAQQHAGEIKLVRLNVDEAPALATRYRAMSIPTLVLMRDGREVDRVVGALPPPRLEAWLRSHLEPPPG